MLRGREGIGARWSLIPAGVDVVLTHGPAAGHGDYVPRAAQHVGCEDLLRELLGRVRPAVAVCGHIHEAAGVTWQRGVAFINASTCNSRYEPIQPPVVFTTRRRRGSDQGALLPAAQVTIAGHPRPVQRGDDAAAAEEAARTELN